MIENNMAQNYDFDAINLFEKIKILSDDEFIAWFINNLLYPNDFYEQKLTKNEQMLFNICIEKITDFDYKIMEHFRGDYTNTSKVYDELYNFAIKYKTNFLMEIKKCMIDALQEKCNIYTMTYINHEYYKTKSQIVVALIETGAYESKNNKIKIFKKYKFIKPLQKNDNTLLNYGDTISFDIYENKHITCNINGNDFRMLMIESLEKYMEIN